MARSDRRLLDGVRRWYRSFVRRPHYARAERLVLRSADRTRLTAAELRGPADAPATVVLVHGFAGSSRSPKVYDFAHDLARSFRVVALDLRGHGGSSGRCTFGEREPDDVAAAVAVAAAGLPVVALGVSLGGASVLLAAAGNDRLAGVVAVSAPAHWGAPDRPSSKRLVRAVNARWGRFVLAWILRTRVELSPRTGANPAERVGLIAPAFTILVHDAGDSYFGPEHAEELYQRAGEPKQLWWRPGGGHGSDLLTPVLAAQVAAEIRSRLGAPRP